MSRPTFIVAEPEPEQALSSRKILLETFKFNVITAHSESELADLLTQFPNVNALILHLDTPGHRGADLISAIKRDAPTLPVIALSPTLNGGLEMADHVVNSHSPEDLLQLLQNLFGDARKIDGASNRKGAG
jgi:CheY-like chemotaxis protein